MMVMMSVMVMVNVIIGLCDTCYGDKCVVAGKYCMVLL